MATTEEVVRKLTITATSEGVAGATDSLNKLADSVTNVAQVTDTSAKQQVSAQSAYDKQTKTVVDGAAAHAKYESAVKVANSALSQGIITNDDYSKRIDLLKKKYLDAGDGAGGFGKAIEGVKARLNEMSGEAGIAGEILTAMGPAGIAAAVGVGALVLVYEKLSEIATEQGQWARQLTQVAETIGVTTTQLQALNEVASQGGLTNGEFTNVLFRMSQQFAQLKEGSGSLFTQLSKGNQDLRNQLSVTKDTATQINLLAQAYGRASEEQKKLILSGFGRGGQGQSFGRVLDSINAAGGVAGAVSENKSDNIATDQIKKWNDLQKAIESATQSAQHNFASIFTDQILSSQKDFAEGMLTISRAAKDFALSDNFKSWMEWIEKYGSMALRLLPGVGLAADVYSAAKGGVNALTESYAKHDKANEQPAEYDNYTPGIASPNKVQPSPGVTAADMAKLVAQLGSAATAQDKYNEAVAKTNALVASGEMDKSTAQRVLNNAALERSTALQQARNSALGGAATVEDAYNTKLESLQKLQQQGANLSQDEINTQLRLTVARAQGTASIDAITDAEHVKRSALTMGTEAGLAYSIAQTEINRQLQAGIPLWKINTEAIKAAAAEAAHATVQTDRLKDAIDTAKSSAASFANDFVSAMLSGKSATDALTASANALGKSLTSAGINNIIKDPTSPVGYVETGIGIVTQWLSNSSEKQKQQEAAQKQAAADLEAKKQAGIERQTQFNDQAATAGIDTSTVAGQLQAFDIQANAERRAEVKAGGEAIVELEKSLAVQRQAIVDKANQQVIKSYNDFLNSIKTGSLSTLSPEDQLKFAQTLFNKDVAGAKAGDQASIDAVTKDAQNLLDLAKSYYASSSGYSDVYKGVTDAISGLSNGGTLYKATADKGKINTADTNDDTWAAYSAQVKLDGGYASGGLITNGIRGVDSLLARVAGGEFVTKTSSVNSSTIGALQYINQTGKTPSGGDASEVVRVLTQGFNGQTNTLVEQLQNIADRITRLENVTRQTSNQRRVPGTKV